ncbi:MAG: hypothetical protein IJ366_05135 [Clostridia bacterium]|nr:hypothetical protein [Clostridia bacterium]
MRAIKYFFYKIKLTVSLTKGLWKTIFSMKMSGEEFEKIQENTKRHREGV